MLVASDSTVSSPQIRFCSWEYFHLPTIGASALLTAAWDGCAEIIEFLLEAGQDPDTFDSGGLTAMMVAILRFNVVVMRCVFRNGEAIRRNLVVDWLKEENQLLQHILAVVELLLRFGATVNARNQEGSTALHYAGNGDALVVAKYLLENGADIDAQDQFGKTPLHHSIREGSLLVVYLLVSRGAQIDIKDVDWVTPLMLAIQQCSMNMLQILLNEHHLVVTPQRKHFAASVLFSAVESEVEEAVRLIIEEEYSLVMVRNSEDETPLHRAIVRRNPQIMELLMRQNLDDDMLTALTKHGDSPVHYAARFGTIHELETLLLPLVTLFGDLQALEIEINPLNATNKEGFTCLYLAGTCRVNSSREEGDAILPLLLRHGARLFRPELVVIPLGTGSSEQIIFHDQVRRGMAAWIREASDRNNEITTDDGDANGFDMRTSNILLTELCVEWIACVLSVSPHSSTAVNERHHSWPVCYKS
ncbi:Ankyrin repeats domain-containing protein [Phytophthora infestans]|uniref:Ankyrin repeats domain-containing protein n=1 Tax=Phytophthora infestans TaxID=4787 RepID=A0A8S9TX91_PHYIN|nr:Ankyrin repeats domain-containing protein [Phytophthora infestans]